MIRALQVLQVLQAVVKFKHTIFRFNLMESGKTSIQI